MSYDASSDSDDFFDAQQDIGSPRELYSPSLVVDDEDLLEIRPCSPNSPSRLGGDLSLDRLLKDSNLTPVVSTESLCPTTGNDESTSTLCEDDQQFKEKTGPSTAGEESSASLEPRDPPIIADAKLLNEVQHDGPEAVMAVPLLGDHPHSFNFDDTAFKKVEKHERSDTSSFEKSSDVREEEVETNTLTEKDKRLSLSLTEISDSGRSSKPDLVASIKERPLDLPGLQPVVIGPGSEGNMESSQPSQSQSNHRARTTVHLSLPRPKRPPPPRPKDPPKRPPPPKSFRPIISSAGDEGLLTPNTAVDNITREFAAALVQDSSTNDPEIEETRKKLNSLARNGSLKDGDYDRKSDLQSERSSNLDVETEQTRKTSSSSFGHVDEGRPWSELTKSTVLKIDSAPGLEILSTVIVRNLDTGQTMPLSEAAEQVSKYLNPLSLQIMTRTKEFQGAANNTTTDDPPAVAREPSVRKPTPEVNQSLASEDDNLSVASDEITIGVEVGSGSKSADGGRKMRTKSKRFKRFLGKNARRMKEAAGTQVERAVQKVKQAKSEGSHADSLNVSSDEEVADSLTTASVKTKVSSSNKGPYQFSHPKLVQDIAVHVGAVWSMKFSHCGRLLATAGQNNIIWIWVLKEWYNFFNDMRKKYDNKDRGTVFATPPRGSMNPPPAGDDASETCNGSDLGGVDQLDEDPEAPFKSLPFSSYYGHTADVLDLAWSKNYFTLSSSMDKTVRLWHVSQKECLCCFQHIDFVTAISFHPRDDRYFLSGSLDGKLRLWNIPEKKVALWNEVSPDSSSSPSGSGGALITTVNFCENGKFAVCGTYDGRCLFYDTEYLKYHTQIHVRSSRGRNQKGHKITGIEPLSNEHKILVTSNDSRVRLYDLRDLSLTCKYRGLTNLSSQIKASFSQDSNFIICGSEDKSIYIWRTNLPQDVTKLSSFRRDRNDCWESIRAHDAVVTCAVFAPKPQRKEKAEASSATKHSRTSSDPVDKYVIISADFNGVIKIFTTS